MLLGLIVLFLKIEGFVVSLEWVDIPHLCWHKEVICINIKMLENWKLCKTLLEADINQLKNKKFQKDGEKNNKIKPL